MHAFPLVIFLTLAAGSSSRPIPAGCGEDHGTCREDCTIEYGGSTKKYRQLGDCLQRCDREQSDCASRHYSLRDAQIDPQPGSREPEPALAEPTTRQSDSSWAEEDAPAKPASTPTGRRDVYRASQAKPSAPTKPVAPAEPAASAEPVAPAKPAVKPTPVAAPAPKPVTQLKPTSASTKEGSSDMRVFDDPEPAPAPKPEPKPVAPSRPTAPPESKKKDISEWDPNGD
jgi:hypothetical protein